MNRRKPTEGQESLFDKWSEQPAPPEAPRAARTSDPETSHQAAAQVEFGALQRKFLNRMMFLWAVWGKWPTANEVAQGNESIRKRAKECVRAGWCIEGEPRPCRITHRNATTYEITPIGKSLLDIPTGPTGPEKPEKNQ